MKDSVVEPFREENYAGIYKCIFPAGSTKPDKSMFTEQNMRRKEILKVKTTHIDK